MPDVALYALREALGFRLGVDLAEIILDYAPVPVADERNYCAATSGEWDKVTDPIVYASRTDNMRLLERHLPLTRHCREFARDIARGGSLGLLRWAAETGYTLTYAAAAASEGHTSLLRWLQRVASEEARMSTAEELGIQLKAAAYGGHLSTVKWLYAQGAPLVADACSEAAGGGHLLVLQWLHERGCPWDRTVVRRAASGGHIALLLWAISEGCDWFDSDDCLEVKAYVRWVEGPESFEQDSRDPRFPWSVYLVCDFAAQFGRLDLLAWTLPKARLTGGLPSPRYNGAPYLCISLARNGCLMAFRDAHSKQRRDPSYWGEQCCGKAMLRMAVTRAAILRRAARQGFRLSRPGTQCMAEQGKHIRWARKRGLKPVEALAWVAANRYPASPEEWAELDRLVDLFATDG